MHVNRKLASIRAVLLAAFGGVLLHWHCCLITGIYLKTQKHLYLSFSLLSEAFFCSGTVAFGVVKLRVSF